MATFFEYLVFAPLTATFFGFLLWLFVAIVLRRVVERVRFRPIVFFVTGYAFIGVLSVYQLIGYEDHDVAPLLGTVASLVLVVLVSRWWRGRRGSRTVARFNRATGPQPGSRLLGGPVGYGTAQPGGVPGVPGAPGAPGAAETPGVPGAPGVAGPYGGPYGPPGYPPYPGSGPGAPGYQGYPPHYPGYPGNPGQVAHPGHPGAAAPAGEPFVPPHGRPDEPGWTPAPQPPPSAGRRAGYPLAAPPPEGTTGLPGAPPPGSAEPAPGNAAHGNPSTPSPFSAADVPVPEMPAPDPDRPDPNAQADIDPTWLEFLATESGGSGLGPGSGPGRPSGPDRPPGPGGPDRPGRTGRRGTSGPPSAPNGPTGPSDIDGMDDTDGTDDPGSGPGRGWTP
ncbi:hypothetical protein [Parafrankia sp. EUN1f]|uniref:hypothetical protein n=1 Tax=Parafrankia sp. EUN1f TaxID=102897 RepID=UPI0001C45F96|nr:hypothetical protein [Parafrankia sp. EUN1f]EFC81468.1 hypothetical protein FrEUN1fDRAFT_5411 [Parafrankia sp. EUN1f]